MALKKKYPEGLYFGMDANQAMMDKIDPAYGFQLSVGKIENPAFKDQEFDLVTARMVIHHAENLDQAFREIRRILKPGGKFIVCEGNPPDRHSLSFYENMFRYKENRHSFLLDDLVNLMLRHDFQKVAARTVIMKDMSLNNWLTNAGVPYRKDDIIRKMHFECDPAVKNAYRMKTVGDDILMEWKFSVVLGWK
jgi:ubiquinone/menaquinone biosynthesis C-methylase UbiE